MTDIYKTFSNSINDINTENEEDELIELTNEEIINVVRVIPLLKYNNEYIKERLKGIIKK